MKVLSVAAAHSSWLFDISDLNPKGKSLFPEMFDWLKDNYHFAQAPASIADLDKDTKALVFLNGEFQAREEVFVAVELRIFNDGLVANSSSSTDDTDKFLEDVLTSAAAEFSLTFEPAMVRRRQYISELNIRLEQPLGNLNPKLVQFANKLTAMTAAVNPSAFEVGGISFWADVTHSVYKIPGFSIERKINAPFNENRFFSRAPLKTQEHIAMLEELEGILAPPPAALRGVVS